MMIRADELSRRHLGTMITVPLGLHRSARFTLQRLEFTHHHDGTLLRVILTGVRPTPDHPRLPVHHDLPGYARVEIP